MGVALYSDMIHEHSRKGVPAFQAVHLEHPSPHWLAGSSAASRFRCQICDAIQVLNAPEISRN